MKRKKDKLDKKIKKKKIRECGNATRTPMSMTHRNVKCSTHSKMVKKIKLMSFKFEVKKKEIKSRE